MTDVARTCSCAASVSTSGVEREPGEVHASRRPQRASSSANARRPRYVSIAPISAASSPTMPSTLVLLHGFTQTRQSWRRTIAALGGRRRALAPDLPGHGHAAARPASFPACTGYVRALGGERFALAGYSMGGRIALTAAFALRDRLRRLPPPRGGPGGGARARAAAPGRAPRRAADEALADRIEAIGVEAFAREWAELPL